MIYNEILKRGSIFDILLFETVKTAATLINNVFCLRKTKIHFHFFFYAGYCGKKHETTTQGANRKH